MRNKISLTEALKLLNTSAWNDNYEIIFAETDKIEATDAIKMGTLGIDVPESNIYYDDDSIADNEDFDGDWVRIISDVENYKQRLYIQLDVEQEVEEWLS